MVSSNDISEEEITIADYKDTKYNSSKSLNQCEYVSINV